MNKLTAALAVAGIVALGFSIPASASQPDNPGCFGQDRAAFLHAAHIGNKEGQLADDTTVPATGDGSPGASGWGAIAGERGSDNGAQNRAYKESCGGEPS